MRRESGALLRRQRRALRDVWQADEEAQQVRAPAHLRQRGRRGGVGAGKAQVKGRAPDLPGMGPGPLWQLLQQRCCPPGADPLRLPAAAQIDRAAGQAGRAQRRRGVLRGEGQRSSGDQPAEAHVAPLAPSLCSRAALSLSVPPPDPAAAPPLFACGLAAEPGSAAAPPFVPEPAAAPPVSPSSCAARCARWSRSTSATVVPARAGMR